MKDTCFHCGAPATKLCDFHIGLVIGGYERVGTVYDNRWRAVMSMKTDRQFYTCDRPLCDACTTNKGRVHVCAGKDSFSDTYDACKDHANDKSEAEMLTDQEAGKIQHELLVRRSPPRGKAVLVHSHDGDQQP